MRYHHRLMTRRSAIVQVFLTGLGLAIFIIACVSRETSTEIRFIGPRGAATLQINNWECHFGYCTGITAFESNLSADWCLQLYDFPNSANWLDFESSPTIAGFGFERFDHRGRIYLFSRAVQGAEGRIPI